MKLTLEQKTALKNGLCPIDAAEKLPVKMHLTVHDEIVSSMPKSAVIEIVPKLIKVMTDNKFMPTIPLYCDADIGPSWKDTVEFKDWREKYAKVA